MDAKCSRCGDPFQKEKVLDHVCASCLKEKKLTTAEKVESNIWDHVQDFGKVYKRMRQGDWSWLRSADCKYVSLLVDMRDGGCIIKDSRGNRIGPNRLEWQIGDTENNVEPED